MLTLFTVGLDAETGGLKIFMNEEIIKDFFSNPKDFEKKIQDNSTIETGIQEVLKLLYSGDKAINMQEIETEINKEHKNNNK